MVTLSIDPDRFESRAKAVHATEKDVSASIGDEHQQMHMAAVNFQSDW